MTKSQPSSSNLFAAANPVLRAKVVTHDLHPKMFCRLDHRLDRLRMGTLHDHDMVGSCSGCLLQLKRAASMA